MGIVGFIWREGTYYRHILQPKTEVGSEYFNDCIREFKDYSSVVQQIGKKSEFSRSVIAAMSCDQNQRYPNYRLGLLKNRFTTENSEKREN